MKTHPYIGKRVRKITLSTGDIITVRPMQRSDFLQLGDIPQFLRSQETAKAFDDADLKHKVEVIAEQSEYWLKLRDHIFTHCITTPGFKVFTGAGHECPEGEIHVDIIDEDDQAAIIAATLTASGVSSGAVATARPFPAKQAATGDAGQVGAALRPESAGVS